jgi:hypothetical protein
MLRAINAYRLGPSVADRALAVLHSNGEIEFQKQGREELVRAVPDLDPLADTNPEPEL